MSKTGLIISREYLSRVRKKSFLITTILVPVVIVAFYAVIIAISFKGGSEETKLAVIDKAGLFSDSSLQGNSALKVSFIQNETEQGFVSKYKNWVTRHFYMFPLLILTNNQNLLYIASLL
jgi:ABC-2 type transport system permease protein